VRRTDPFTAHPLAAAAGASKILNCDTLNENFYDYGMAAPDGVAALRTLVAESRGLVASVVEDSLALTAAADAALFDDDAFSVDSAADVDHTAGFGRWKVEAADRHVQTRVHELDGYGHLQVETLGLERKGAASPGSAGANANPWSNVSTAHEWDRTKGIDRDGDDAFNFDDIITAGKRLAAAAGEGHAADVDFVTAASPMLHAVKGRISTAFRS